MPDNSSLPKTRMESIGGILFWVAVVFMLVIPSWLFMDAFGDAQRQHHVNRAYQLIDGKVLSSEVTHWEDSHHNVHYDAQINYQYEVGGKTYHSGRLAALPLWGGEEWAQSIVDRYKTGELCKVYYDPANPDKAILLRGYQFDPYFEMLEGAFIFSGGSFFVLFMWYAKKKKITPAGNGWFAVAPESGERQRLLAAKVCTAVWYAVGAIPATHYFLCVPQPHSARSIRDFEIFFALGLIPILFLVRYWRMNQNMAEAQLLLEKSEGMLGQKIKFSISQDIRQPLQLKEASVRLLCLGVKRQGKSSTSTTLFEETPAEIKSRELHAGENLELSGEFTVPTNQQPSGRDRTGKYDWIVWKIIFESDIAHAPDYYVEYRLEVKAPPVTFPEPAVKPAVSADIRAIESEFAGRIMSRGHLAMAFLLSLLPVVIQLSGVVLALPIFLKMLPDKPDAQWSWNLLTPHAQLVLEIGVALIVIGTTWGIAFSGRVGNGYMRMVAKREIKRRPSAIVQSDANSTFVDIVPRENWNKMVFKNAADIGFLVVDAARREIRFEGDKERYRIPADALLSCEVEKSVYTSTAKPTAPGFFLLVLRAETESGKWEAPVSPRGFSSIFNSKGRLRAANALQSKIRALKPANIPAESHRRTKAAPQDSH